MGTAPDNPAITTNTRYGAFAHPTSRMHRRSEAQPRQWLSDNGIEGSSSPGPLIDLHVLRGAFVAIATAGSFR
uniref:Uncharacterized protein n=1 Tax=Candidatus Kentrum sp. FW TaxID=2126338 RepID=A0A450TXY3_9GAMM|nr:MAG: hypothetical protein BECKFW1821C_GA0114237_106117 [Candidatus Kentron sp. FW]